MDHPADKQTPPQCKAEKHDATAKPSDTRPAAPTHEEDPQHPGPRTCPTPIPLPEVAPRGNPHRSPRSVHPEINPGQSACPNHADPSNPPPPDRTRTGVRNQNLNWNHPGPNDAHPHPRPTTHIHPRRKTTPTPTFEQLPEHIRHLTPRLTPPHPLPQILRPASRVHSLKERAPAMRWYLPGSLGGPYGHRFTEGPRAGAGCQNMRRPKNPGDIPAHTQAPQAQPGPQPGGNTHQEPRAPKQIPDPPRSSPATRPVTYVRRHKLPKSIACSHQSPTPVGAIAPGTRSPSGSSPGTPQMPQTQTTPPHLPQCPTE
ncbi:extensin-like [Girardinichthys multiradiatus]|uniref:extensin-like n=1 Tax=Girardinichthys multiradiatus TaxID=208333 RepID=UPI001FACFEC4|nr:extensin-like [Girardinichthys multiradiatus]